MRHLPNVITALRFLLIPVLVLLLVEQRFVAAFAVFVVSALSDLADAPGSTMSGPGAAAP